MPVLLIPLLGFAPDDRNEPTTLVYPTFLHTMGIRKATKTHLRIYTKNQVKVQDPQGIAVTLLTSWDDPGEKKDDDLVTGYGVNSGSGMIVYNTSMTSLTIYGINESGIKALNRPMGIAANERGDVYVADTGNHRIVRFSNPKKKLEFVKALGQQGALAGQFKSPQDVVLDSRGMVYVADTGNHRIQVLLPDDTVHLWFGKQGIEPGQLWHPTAIAVNDAGERWSYYRDNFIAIIDLDNRRVQKFSLTGEFLKAITLQDIGLGQGELAYLAIDYYSNVWATDRRNNKIHKFDRDLNYLTSFGEEGTGERTFSEPRGIAIRRRFGQVFIAEKESAQYYWIGTDILGFQAQFVPPHSLVRLAFLLTEPSYVTLSVHERGSKEKYELLNRKLYFSGHREIYLDGEGKIIPDSVLNGVAEGGNGVEDGIRPVQAGTYSFTIKVEPTYSSYQHFSKTVKTEVIVD